MCVCIEKPRYWAHLGLRTQYRCVAFAKPGLAEDAPRGNFCMYSAVACAPALTVHVLRGQGYARASECLTIGRQASSELLAVHVPDAYRTRSVQPYGAAFCASIAYMADQAAAAVRKAARLSCSRVAFHGERSKRQSRLAVVSPALESVGTAARASSSPTASSG